MAEERQAIDEVIRTWFFTPQDQLYGLTPRRVIRNEELGLPNKIPLDRLGDDLFDDCPICQAMMEEAEELQAAGEHDHGWNFGLAPDITLLDQYDPEGYDERWRLEDERQEECLAGPAPGSAGNGPGRR